MRRVAELVLALLLTVAVWVASADPDAGCGGDPDWATVAPPDAGPFFVPEGWRPDAGPAPSPPDTSGPERGACSEWCRERPQFPECYCR